MTRGTESTRDELFAGRPASLLLFRLVRAAIEPIGPWTMRATKTQMSFAAVRGFAGFSIPQKWTSSRADDGAALALVLDRRVEDARIEQAVEPRPGRWAHHVVIADTADVDAQVRAGLGEASAIGAADRTRGRA